LKTLNNRITEFLEEIKRQYAIEIKVIICDWIFIGTTKDPYSSLIDTIEITGKTIPEYRED
jgi:hypothetical protein